MLHEFLYYISNKAFDEMQTWKNFPPVTFYIKL